MQHVLLTLIRGTREGDVVMFELKSEQQSVVIKLVPRLYIFSGINVDETYWPDDSSNRTQEDVIGGICSKYSNIPPPASEGEEGEMEQFNSREE